MEFKRAKLDSTVTAAGVTDSDGNNKTKVIGTHSGTFQADEAMGVWMLLQLPEYQHATIIRSRDPTILSTCDLVLDVGGIYNHDEKKYDHHQRDYEERFEFPKGTTTATDSDTDPTPTDGRTGHAQQRCTKLSASGLIYRHYGKDVIRSFYPLLSQSNLDLTYVKLYDSLLEALDAIDTGVEMVPAGITTLYKDITGLSSRVSRLNPRWNEVEEETGTPPNPDDRFHMATQICGQDFISVLVSIVESYLPAREIVQMAIQERHSIDSSGEIIQLPNGGLPWRSHLYEIEKELNVDPQIKFVLYTDQAGMWRVQAVTVEGMAFENRLSLPEEWRGLRDQDLVDKSQIPACRFVHAAGFIGGNDTLEGALEMARIALTRK